MAKAISLDNLQKFRQKYDERLENGSLVPNQSDFAKNLIPVSTESGDTQETPFIGQGTGTANGTSSVDTGKTGKHIQKQGAVYCVNQLIEISSLQATNSNNGITATNNGDGTFTLTGTGETAQSYVYMFYRSSSSVFQLEQSHKYLFFNTSNTNLTITFYDNGTTGYASLLSGGTIITGHVGLKEIFKSTSVGTTLNTKTYIGCVDLTQWFNGNIPQDLLDHPDNFFRYYQGSLAYNTGTLVPSNGRYLVCSQGKDGGHSNVWNEQWETGKYNTNTGAYIQDNTRICSKQNEPISVIPNTTYHFENVGNAEFIGAFEYDTNDNFVKYTYVGSSGNVKMQPNTKYLRFMVGSGYGATYLNNITISLYYAGEDYSQYYPYVEPKVYDTGTETLLSTGVKLNAQGEREDIYDYKEPSGEITRRVGSVDLSTLSWTNYAPNKFSATLTGGKPQSDGDVPFNAICSKLIAVGANVSLDTSKKQMSLGSNNTIYVANSDWNSSSDINGILYFEKAIPTTEQGTPFSENIEIEDFGDMSWYSAYTSETTNTSVSVPQGCKIFYPAWYVGFIDTLGNREDVDWDADNLVAKGTLASGDPDTLKALLTYVDNLHSIEQENIGGALRHQLSQANSLDFNNTAWVDLGSLTWTKYSVTEGNLFRSNTISGANISTSSTPIIICTIYKQMNGNVRTNKSISCGIANSVDIVDNSYTDATSFKTAMKGILLAYEKAS